MNKALSADSAERTAWLRDWKTEHHITNAQLATLCNISRRTVEGWINKEQTPAPVTALLHIITMTEPEILNDTL